MSDDSAPDGQKADWLADPWTAPRDPRGRKSHKRNSEVAEKVAVLRATGSKVEEIAVRLGLSEPTLRKYYFRELDQGPAIAKAMLTEAMWAQTLKKGNAALIKLVFDMLEKGQGVVPVARPTQGHKAEKEDQGKKATANREAHTAHEGTSWGNLLTH